MLSLALTLMLAGMISFDVLAFSNLKFEGKKARWCDGKKPNLRVDAKSIPADSEEMQAFEEAVADWNQNPTEFYFNFHSAETGDYSKIDTEPEVLFVDGKNKDLGGFPGITLMSYWEDGCIADSDILMSDDENWTTSTFLADHKEYSPFAARSLQTTFMHELGHAAGIGHEDSKYSIMGVDWKHMVANDSLAVAFVGADGKAGLVDLYALNDGGDSFGSDWAVTHWVYSSFSTGSSEYANADKSKIYSAANSSAVFSESKFVNLTSAEGQTGQISENFYNVYPGMDIEAEFTFEAATRSKNTTVGVLSVFSDDRDITPDDEKLGWSEFNCKSNACISAQKLPMTLPFDVMPGQYYLGVMVNPDPKDAKVSTDIEQLDEYSFENNTTHIGVLVQEPPFYLNVTPKWLDGNPVQTVLHGDTTQIVSDYDNALKIEIVLNKYKKDKGPWHVDRIWHDSIQGKDMHEYNYWPNDLPLEFELKNIRFDPKGKHNKVFVRLRNESESFGLAFEVAETPLTTFLKDVNVPHDLLQYPKDGKVSGKMNNWPAGVNVDFHLQARVGQIKKATNGMSENCQVEYAVFPVNKPDNVVLKKSSTKLKPGLIAGVEIKGLMKEGSYQWKARTVCSGAQSDFVIHGGNYIQVKAATENLCGNNPMKPDCGFKNDKAPVQDLKSLTKPKVKERNMSKPPHDSKKMQRMQMERK